jgi:hypothetical protein
MTQLKITPEQEARIKRYSVCRDVRHAWAVENDYHVYKQYQEAKGSRSMYVARDLVCMRCTTVRHEIYLATKRNGLERVSTSYAYPPGFLIQGIPAGSSAQSILAQIRYREAMEAVAHASKSDRERGDR